MTLRLETRKSKLAARNITPAKAGFYEVVDSRLQANDLLGGFRVRISSFDSAFCLLASDSY
jgi:hypothetical protein